MEQSSTPQTPGPAVAYFISSHGFGHAARASAVMAALQDRLPSISFEIFTQIPRWAFDDSAVWHWHYHAETTDVGLVQDTPLEADLAATNRNLDRFLQFDAGTISRLAETITRKQCRLVIADISPLGIQVAKSAGLPVVLVENFTWDWIYEGYREVCPDLMRHAACLRPLFASVDFLIQAEPVCQVADPDLLVSPISRSPRNTAEQTRRRLGLERKDKVVVITMGGIPDRFGFLDHLTRLAPIRFIIPGGSGTLCIKDNLILLPHHSDFYHPDLILAADAVVGKLGYSTLAEVYHSGMPFAYITRTGFRESAVLSAYCQTHLPGFPLTDEVYKDLSWIDKVPELIALPWRQRQRINGADQAAQFLQALLNEPGSYSAIV